MRLLRAGEVASGRGRGSLLAHLERPPRGEPSYSVLARVGGCGSPEAAPWIGVHLERAPRLLRLGQGRVRASEVRRCRQKAKTGCG